MAITGEARFNALKTLKALGANLTEQQMADALGIGLVSQAEAEAGTATTIRFMTAERIAQAIAALGVTGPASSTDNAIARFDGTGGKTLQNSANGPRVDDTGRIWSGFGSDAALFGGPFGTFNKPPGDDLDNVSQNGIYLIDASTTANNPAPGNSGFAHAIGDSTNIRLIAWTRFTNNAVWTRIFSSGAWSSWERIPTTAAIRMIGAFDFRAEQTLASAATTDLGSVSGNIIQVTGTATINSFGTAAAGTYRIVRAGGVMTLTHNATSLILPGGANITTAVNDFWETYSLGSGNWIVTNYQRADGTALAGGGLGTPDYDSGEQTVTLSNVLSLTHSIGAKPNLIVVSLRCKTTEDGYSVDEEIDLNEVGHNTTSRNYSVSKDSTQIHIIVASEIITISKSTQAAVALTPANWKWVIRAWK